MHEHIMLLKRKWLSGDKLVAKHNRPQESQGWLSVNDLAACRNFSMAKSRHHRSTTIAADCPVRILLVAEQRQPMCRWLEAYRYW